MLEGGHHGIVRYVCVRVPVLCLCRSVWLCSVWLSAWLPRAPRVGSGPHGDAPNRMKRFYPTVIEKQKVYK